MGKPWKSGFVDFAQQGSGSSGFKPNQTGSILGTPKTQSVAKLPYQKVTDAQMQERRRKDLCYFCEEK